MKYIIHFLTISRILAGPMIFILLNYGNGYLLTILLFFLASISDFFDGFLARKYSLTSQLGEILDPIADKILLLFCLFPLALHLESSYIGFVGCLILTREFWVSALRDFNSRNGSASFTKVTFLAKLKTTIQLCAIGSYLLGLLFGNALIIFISDFILLLALIITIHTGSQYTLESYKKISS
jgi:CDP-diacylglycerol---glycerol-3-phosphate 3-phosphatidyltransferase